MWSLHAGLIWDTHISGLIGIQKTTSCTATSFVVVINVHLKFKWTHQPREIVYMNLLGPVTGIGSES